jgi:alpha-tubulin suppressor-like RCC1 family protein
VGGAPRRPTPALCKPGRMAWLITFSDMFLSRPMRAIWLLAIASIFAISSCQSTSSTDNASAKELSYEIVARVGCVPDSATWSFAGQSGTGKATRKPGSSTTAVINFSLPKPPGSETVTANYWTLSVHTATETIVGSTRTVTWKDELGLTLLTRLDSLRKSADSARYPLSASSVLQIYAKALVDHDSTFKGFPAQRVTSLDTTAVYNAALIYAASKHVPIAIQSKSWLLGLDSATANKLVSKLMAPAGPISVADSLLLFPPYPVRVATPVGVGALNVGGNAVAVTGSFVGDSGLSSYKVRVLQGVLDVSDQFTIATQPTQLDGSQTTWNLATDARLTLQVKTALVGSYTLEVSVSDKKTRTDTSRVGFTVALPIDRTGPSITWLAPTSNTLLENADSILLVKINATDPSGIDSVWIDGMPATKTDSVWTRSVTIPVSELGYDLDVRARDTLKNQTDSVLRIGRKGVAVVGAPVARLVSPATKLGTQLPFDSSAIDATWIIRDANGVVDSSVLIDGALAKKLNDSAWTRRVTIPPTGSATTVTLQASNAKGLSVSDFFYVVRLKDPIPPMVKRNGFDTVVSIDSSSLLVSWTVKDNAKLATVLVNGIAVASTDSVYSTRINLSIGSNRASVVATDSAGNSSGDSLWIVRRNDTVKSVVVSDTISKLRSGAFWVKLSTPTTQAKIYYSLDGSEPNEQSSLFKDSLKIDTTLTLKARAYVSPRAPSVITAQKYNLALPVNVFAGGNHTLILMSDASLWGYGSNTYGELGLGDQIKTVSKPVKIADSVVDASSGMYFSLFIKSDSSLWGMGNNDSGQLADGTNTRRTTPVLITRGVRKALAAHGLHSFVLKRDNSLWGAGNNPVGNLGIGNTKSQNMLVKISDSVADMNGGLGRSHFLKLDGTLWGMGAPFDGGLGINATDIQLVPVKIMESVSLIQRAYGTSNLVTKTDGTLWVFGQNVGGQLGTGDSATVWTPKQVAFTGTVSVAVTGTNHSLVLTKDGTLWAMGSNALNQLGADFPSVQTTPRVLATRVIAVSAGQASTIYLRDDKTVWTMGPAALTRLKF